MRKDKSKPVWEMTPEELTRYAARFDREFVIDDSREMTASERAEWQRARRQRGRPRRGAGVKVISVSVEKRLLAATDRLAKRKHLTRARLIERGLRAVLAAECVRVRSA